MLKAVLETTFGYNDFKNSLQREAAEAIYEGKKDVFIKMPSGFGKSIIFQLPVVAKENTFAIVISPTIIDAKMQVDYLKTKNVLAYNWNNHTSKNMKLLIKKNMLSKKPKIKLLYITPEQYLTSHFQHIMREIEPNVLSYFVVDEAHNISPFSDSFSLSYTKLHNLKLPSPIIAVTSTATTQVKKDIINCLKMVEPLQFSLPVYRPNLFYDVWFNDTLPNPILHLKHFIENCSNRSNNSFSKMSQYSGIIFCTNNDEAMKLTEDLKSMGITAVYYDNRSSIQKSVETLNFWNAGNFNVLVTLNNSSIGVQKTLVRFVVHWGLPQVLRNYFQETGRAGHNGDESYCRIYCNYSEFNNSIKKYNPSTLWVTSELSKLMNTHKNTKNLSFIQLKKDILSLECRHNMFSKYFGDPTIECKNSCDNCQNKNVVEERTLKSLSHLNIYKNNDSFKNKNSLVKKSFVDNLSDSSRVKKFPSKTSWDLSAEAVLKNIYKIKSDTENIK